MSFNSSETKGVASDNSMNAKFLSLLKDYKKSANSKTEKHIQDIEHKAPAGGSGNNDMMHSNIMNFTTLLEAADMLLTLLSEEAYAEDPDMMDTPMDDDNVQGTSEVDEKSLLDELNRTYTPILVSQGFEQKIADETNAEISEATVLTEKNMISFDNTARMSQLIATCALLIAKQKNSEKWQMFKKAAALKRQSKLDIQKEEYDSAKALAQKYLVMVSTTNNSSVARNAANELLPETQH